MDTQKDSLLSVAGNSVAGGLCSYLFVVIDADDFFVAHNLSGMFLPLSFFLSRFFFCVFFLIFFDFLTFALRFLPQKRRRRSRKHMFVCMHAYI